MSIRIFQSLRLLTFPVLMVAASACNLTIATQPAVPPQFIVVTATLTTGKQEQPLPSSTLEPTLAPTLTQTLTLTFTPSQTLTATATPVTMTAGQDLSCVKGPHWILYEWVAKIATGETVTLLAKAPPEWKDYYYVHKSDGTECWAFGASSVIHGDPSTLPEMAVPLLPTVTYTIENKTYLSVTDVYIRGKGEADWGADRLGAGSIAPGTSFSLNLTAGFYDVLIKDYMSGVLYQELGRPIGSDANYHYTLLKNETNYFIQNNYGFNLCTISTRPHIGGAWIDVHTAADGPIAPGNRAYFNTIVGQWDIRIKDCSSVTILTIIGIYIGPTSIGHNVP